MSVTSRLSNAPSSRAWRAVPRFTKSCGARLISAGEPAPSMTTSSHVPASRCRLSRAAAASVALRSRQPARPSAASTRPCTTTCDAVSRSGLSSTGFMSTPGSAPAASAWKYCAAPISAPSPSRPATTRALLLMFCALNGRTTVPRRAAERHSAVASQLLPAPLDVPQTITKRVMAGPRPGQANTGRKCARMAANSADAASRSERRQASVRFSTRRDSTTTAYWTMSCPSICTA